MYGGEVLSSIYTYISILKLAVTIIVLPHSTHVF